MAESVDAPDLKSVGHNARGSSSLPTRITHKYNGYTASVMNYRIDTEYAWYDTQEGSKIIFVYMIQNVPFTFDELPEIARANPSVIQLANSGPRWDAEKMYQSSMYLMAEECHPMCFDLELENPELLPVD